MSDSILDSPLRRLHRELVQALRERDPAGLGRPFTVAEIYQDLVPYRTHRDLLGIEINGDYEHLILRLLGGEEGLVALESDHARREIEAELSRSNPNTGLFREYAAVDVHLVAEHIPTEEESVILPLPDSEDAPDDLVMASVDDLAPADEHLAHEQAMDDEQHDVKGTVGDDGVCFWCRGTLPARENLHFCPFCGTDIGVVPCGSCGEAIEPGWRFCIQCGADSGEA